MPGVYGSANLIVLIRVDIFALYERGMSAVVTKMESSQGGIPVVFRWLVPLFWDYVSYSQDIFGKAKL